MDNRYWKIMRHGHFVLVDSMRRSVLKTMRSLGDNSPLPSRNSETDAAQAAALQACIEGVYVAPQYYGPSSLGLEHKHNSSKDRIAAKLILINRCRTGHAKSC